MNSDHIASTIVTTTTPAELIAAGFLARYPAKTREGYRIHLRHWFEFCHLHRVDPMSAQRMHIEAFARHLSEDLERMPQTVGGKLNAVCGLYRFAYLDGLIPIDPGAHVRRPKIPFQSSTEGLTRPEFADMLAAAERDGIATHAMICLLGLNGLRIGECLASNVEHLGTQRGYRTIHLPHRKGGKVGTLSLAVRTSWAIEKAIGDRETGPILLGADGQRVSAGSARRTVALDRPSRFQNVALLRPEQGSDRTQRHPRRRRVRRSSSMTAPVMGSHGKRAGQSTPQQV